MDNDGEECRGDRASGQAGLDDKTLWGVSVCPHILARKPFSVKCVANNLVLIRGGHCESPL